GRVVVRAMRLDDALPIVPVSGSTRGARTPPRRVAEAPPDAPTRDLVAATFGDAAAVLASAPLTATGGALTIIAPGPAVAAQPLLAIVSEGGVARVATLVGWVGVGAAPTAYAVRFADIDGDGRTDAVMQQSGRDERTARDYQVFLAPRASLDLRAMA